MRRRLRLVVVRHQGDIEVVSDVNFDTKLFSELVDACALRTHNTPDILLVNVEFSGLE